MSTIRRNHVLTVDDEPDVRLLCRVNLEPEGFCVSEAADGQEALAVLACCAERVDVILLDVMMPVMNGWELLAALKAHPDFADIPVVMFSAWTRYRDRVRGLDAGAVDFVEKPFSPAKLVIAVRAAAAGESCAVAAD